MKDGDKVSFSKFGTKEDQERVFAPITIPAQHGKEATTFQEFFFMGFQESKDKKGAEVTVMSSIPIHLLIEVARAATKQVFQAINEAPPHIARILMLEMLEMSLEMHAEE